MKSTLYIAIPEVYTDPDYAAFELKTERFPSCMREEEN